MTENYTSQFISKHIDIEKIVNFALSQNVLPRNALSYNQACKDGEISYSVAPHLNTGVGSLKKAIEKVSIAGNGNLAFSFQGFDFSLRFANTDYHFPDFASWSISFDEACIKALSHYPVDHKYSIQAQYNVNWVIDFSIKLWMEFHPIWAFGSIFPWDHLDKLFGHREAPAKDDSIEIIKKFNFFFWLNIYSAEILKDGYDRKLKDKISQIESKYSPYEGRRFEQLKDGAILYIISHSPHRYSDRYYD